jgi:acetyl-CoA synthetase
MAYDFEKFVPVKMLEMIEKYRITTFCVPATFYRFLIREDLSKYDLSSIKHAATAGEPLNPEVFNQFYKATGLKIYEGFGMTETTVLFFNSEWVTPIPGSMGKPSPLYDIDLFDEEGNSAPLGEEGAIGVKNLDKNFPVGLFKGYLENGKINKSCFDGDIYYTGDVAYRDVSGHYWFVGRNDDMIKCSGYRIGPFEVESALLEHPAVLESAITGFPDEIRGQVVKATVVLNKGYTPSEVLIKELQEHVKKTTAPYKYPRVVEFVSELPKTLSNKIKRAQIRKQSEEI